MNEKKATPLLIVLLWFAVTALYPDCRLTDNRWHVWERGNGRGERSLNHRLFLVPNFETGETEEISGTPCYLFLKINLQSILTFFEDLT